MMDLAKFRAYASAVDPEYADLAEEMEKISLCLKESRLNVTAIKDEEGILSRHIIDSLYAARELGNVCKDGDRLCDVGSGGGFPALPVAAALGGVRVTAMDSTAKKCRYIAETAKSAGLVNVDTVSVRAEEATELFDTFDAVCARAVAALPVLCELCAPLLRVGGHFVAMKGEKAADEIAEASHAAKVLGLELLRVVEYSLPEGGDHRALAVYRKVAPTPKGYPREYKRIVKAPL